MERKHQRHLKRVADACDLQPRLTNRINPRTSSTHNVSDLSTQPSSQRARPSRNLLTLESHRSQTAQPSLFQSNVTSPTMTPCITAYNLNADQLKKNYSLDNVWDTNKTKLPPVARTQGFGRYTTAVDASPAWRAKHLSRRIMNLGADLGTPMNVADLCGINQDEWREVEQELKRINTSSSTGGDSASSRASSMSVDPQTGTRTVRGFSPATISSSRSTSPLGTTSTHPRGSANTAHTLAHARSISRGTVRASSAFDRTRPHDLFQRRASTALDSIEELHLCRVHGKKVEQPCDFTQRAVVDSAIVLDASDDERSAVIDVDSSSTSDAEDWSDVPSLREPTKISAITQMLEEQNRAELECALQRIPTNSSTASKTSNNSTGRGLTRSRTVKSLKSAARRASKVKLGTTNRHKSVDATTALGETIHEPDHVEHDTLTRNRGETQDSSLPRNAQDVAAHRRYRSATVIYCQPPVEPALDTAEESRA